MKKYLIILAIAHILCFHRLCLLPIACKTKQVVTHQEEQKTELAQRLIQQEENTQKNSVRSEEIQTDIKELQELIANLNVSFDGKELEDKLDILLRKTDEGTKLTFQGKGNVTYSENIKTEIQIFKNELLKHQDSIFSTLRLKLSNLEQNLNHYFKEKDKEVKMRGFSFGGYVSLSLWILLIIALLFLAWRLKLFRWFPIVITKFKKYLNSI